jgi:ABC-type uncharacterized transport system permease subunit
VLRIKIVKREKDSFIAQVIVSFCSVLAALAFGWVFMYVAGYSPGEIYLKMLKGALGTSYAISETIVKAIPLILAGLAVSLAFRMKLWNIGAEGQIYMGAFAASGLALAYGDFPTIIILPLLFVAAFMCGGIWGLIPGFLKAHWNVNETITTLMLNYVAIFWVDYLVFNPWKDPLSFGFPLSPRFHANAFLPTFGNRRVHLGIVVAILIAIILLVVLKHSRWGYEIRVIGESQAAAHYAGINVKRNIMLVMFISAGIAGIAGMIEVTGITHRLQPGFSPGYGYTAIIVAWLGRLHPLWIIGVGFLFGALLVGGFGVQTAGIPFSNVEILQGAVLFFLLAGEIFTRYKIVLVKEGVTK